MKPTKNNATLYLVVTLTILIAVCGSSLLFLGSGGGSLAEKSRVYVPLLIGDVLGSGVLGQQKKSQAEGEFPEGVLRVSGTAGVHPGDAHRPRVVSAADQK